MPADKPRRPRTLRPEERALWDEVAKSVRRNAERAAIPDDPEDPDMQTGPAQAKRRPVRRRIPPPADLPPSPRLPDLAPGVTPGMDRRTAQRLKRGKLDVEATLDLHGHTQTAAHRALTTFLSASADAGRRTVRVVTGKGGRDGQPGVLKQAVPGWLNEMPIRQWVAGFSYAAVRDGGEGALYIRLRRKR